MGRKLKYKTYEELMESCRTNALNYYYKNKDIINKKRMNRYNKLKQQSLTKNNDKIN
jgi:hypothetical protein